MSKTPVVLFIFKRSETLPRIIAQVKKYSPHRMYIIADGGRTEKERELSLHTRNLVVSLIDWDCEIITDFSETNVGVYNRIGEGAKWVFSKEKTAIFLEDDNLPEDTFFDYCDSLLERYNDDKDIGWICGTNYLGDSSNLGNESYYYSRHLFPCGWASWSDKFLKFYDGELVTLNINSINKMKETYADKRLFKQELQSIKQTRLNYLRNPKSVSWDRQMCFSIRSTKKFGIAPHVNQIKNIGADMHSEHGGTSMDNEMTSRFCEVPTYLIQFPLIPPDKKEVNVKFEEENSLIILYSLKGRLKRYLGRLIKIVLGIDPDDSLALILKNRKNDS